jgi:hypothetical protein
MSLGTSKNMKPKLQTFRIHLDMLFCFLFRLKIFLKLLNFLLYTTTSHWSWNLEMYQTPSKFETSI